MRRLALAVLLLLVSAASAGAQLPVVGTQAGNTKNQEAISAVNTAATITLTATAATRVHLYSVAMRCSAGTASVTVADGGTTLWSSDAAFVTTTTTAAAWIPPLTGGINKAVVVTLSTCGVGNTGTIDVQADIY